MFAFFGKVSSTMASATSPGKIPEKPSRKFGTFHRTVPINQLRTITDRSASGPYQFRPKQNHPYLSDVSAKGPYQNFSSQKCLLQNGFQPVAEFGRLHLAFLQIGEQLGGVAVVLLDGVWVLEIEVVVAGFDLVDRDLPGDFVSFAFLPPVDAGVQVFERIGLVIE